MDGRTTHTGTRYINILLLLALVALTALFIVAGPA